MAVDYFQPLSFQQANPLLSGIQAGQQIYGQGVQNRYMAPLLSQQLQSQQLQNAMRQIQNQYLPQQLQSGIGLTQAQTGLAGAQARDALARAGFTGAQTNLLQQETPYDVQKAAMGVYTDPILSRAAQAQTAAQTGAVSPAVLSMLGMGQQQSQQQPADQTAPQTPGGLSQTDTGTPISWTGMQPQPTAMTPGLPSQGALTPGTAPQAFTGTPGQNWLMFGSPINPFQMAAMKQQATSGVDLYNAAQTTAAKDANDATTMNKYIDQFNDAYGKSTYKGVRLGTMPTRGLFAPPGNLQNEVNADNAAQNMQAIMVKLLGSGKITNQELGFAGNLKINRAMPQQSVQELSDFMKAKNNQIMEQQQFLNAAKNQGVDVQTANTLWNRYINQRPVYDFQSRSANDNFQGSYNDYLTPQAVNAARSGQAYVPIPQNFRNAAEKQHWFNNLAPQEKLNVQQQLQQQQGQ